MPRGSATSRRVQTPISSRSRWWPGSPTRSISRARPGAGRPWPIPNCACSTHRAGCSSPQRLQRGRLAHRLYGDDFGHLLSRRAQLHVRGPRRLSADRVPEFRRLPRQQDGHDVGARDDRGEHIASRLCRGRCRQRHLRDLAGGGQTYTFNLTGSTWSGAALANPELRLYNGSGALLLTNDDFNGPASRIVYTASASGTYYLDAHSFTSAGVGGYQLSANLNFDDFRTARRTRRRRSGRSPSTPRASAMSRPEETTTSSR